MELYARRAKSPLKSIRLFCFECMGMTRTEKDPPKPIEDVKGCTDDLCPLFDFRLGRNTHRSVSQKQREAGKNLASKSRIMRQKSTQNQRSSMNEYPNKGV